MLAWPLCSWTPSGVLPALLPLVPQPCRQAALCPPPPVEMPPAPLPTAAAGCLLNYYRTGSDSLSWHSDNEKLYGQAPTVASVSLGTPRDFLLRRNADPKDKYRCVGISGGRGRCGAECAAAKFALTALIHGMVSPVLCCTTSAEAPAPLYRFLLGEGSLLVMRGSVQEHWTHSVPKRKGVEGGRINLTFRRITRPEGGSADGGG